MPLWPFKKRRRNDVKQEKDLASQPLIESEKAQPAIPPRAAHRPTASTSSAIPVPRRSSKRPPYGDESEKRVDSFDQENVPPSAAPVRDSHDITALPMSYQLQHSPHLRPVDMEKPAIPYNFRNYSGSQTSVQPDVATPSPKPNLLRKKRSSYDSTPQRHRSTRSRKDEQVREEEIRAMSAQSPIPKRPGEGALRRDSKKMRSGMKDSQVSLPAHEESLHESMPGIVEQRGWEIGLLDVFNPRPAVRLSGVPQYVTPSSPPMSSPSSPDPSRKKEKMPESRDSARKRETIGNRADDLDAMDIRMILERDAKRKEKRKKDQQDKLDRKLRGREGRNRGDSDRRRRDTEEARKAEEEARARDPMTPPTDIHPALRNTHEDRTEPVGLGIEEGQATAGAAVAATAVVTGVALEQDSEIAPADQQQEDPFADPVEEDVQRPSTEHMPGTYTPSETPMEDPVLETAKEVRMSQASSPPLSPVHSNRDTTRLSQIATDSRRTSDVPAPTPASAVAARRASQPAPERRVGALASLFRRGGRGAEVRAAPSEASFSNTSRESMRNQPLPPHLVDTQVKVPSTRRASGTPARTQSKFREDLPELPISPPDSRTASPDVTMAAAAAAAARRAQRTPQPIEVAREGSTTTFGSEPQVAGRYDTPVSPSLRPGTSMASVDSEAAWLSSGKRQSRQSGLGSRRPEFSSSYEELGGDTDAQHFSRASANAESVDDATKNSTTVPRDSQTTAERDFYDAPERLYDPPEDVLECPDKQPSADPSTPKVHQSVRRQPTLVHRDPRVRSREGLLTEFGGDIPEPTSATTDRGSFEMDSDIEGPEPELARATSMRVHARNISTGSAKLLDVPPRSMDVRSDTSMPGSPRTPTKL